MPRKYNIEFEIDPRGTVKGLKAAGASADQWSGKAATADARTKAWKASLKSLGVAFGLTFGATAIFQGIRRATDLAEQQAQALAQLRAATFAAGDASGAYARRLAEQAAGLQKVTRFGDEAVIGLQAILLSFKNLGEQTIPAATEAVLDIATRMGQDTRSAAIQLGKALDDPIRGLDGLSRSGTTFSQVQKDVIKGLAEAGEMGEAQALILEEIAAQYGNSARMAALAAGGPFQQFKNSLNDVLEVIGKPFLMGLDLLARGLERVWKLLVAMQTLRTGGTLEDVKKAWVELANTVNDLAEGYSFAELAQRNLTAAQLENAAVGEKDQQTKAALEAQLKAVEAEIDRLTKSMAEHRKEVEKAAQAYLDMLDATDRLEHFTRGIGEQLAGERSPLLPTPEQIRSVEGPLGDLLAGLTEEWERLMEQASADAWRAAWRDFIFWAAAAFATALGDALDIMLGNKEGSFTELFHKLGREWGAEAGGALGDYLGGPIGEMIGRSVGAAIGEWAARTISKLFGSGDTSILGTLTVGAGGGEIIGASNLGSLEEAYRFLNEVIRQIEGMTGGTIDLLGQIKITVDSAGRIFVGLFDDFGNLISQAEFDNMGDAVEHALLLGLQHADLSGLGQAFAEIIENAVNFDQLMQDIQFVAQLPRTLQQMGGPAQRAAAAILETRRAFNDMRNQIADLGLSAEAAAPLLELVARAERNRMKELRVDALGQLADMAEQLGIKSKFVLKIREAELKIQLGIIRAQLVALGIWEQYAKLFKDIEKAALDALNNVEELAPAVSAFASEVKKATGGFKVQATFTEKLADLLASGQTSDPLTSILDRLRDFMLNDIPDFPGRPQARLDALARFFATAREVIDRVVEEARRPLREFREGFGATAAAGGFATDRVHFAEKQFRDTLAAALGGDFEAFQRLQGLAETLLSLSTEAYGAVPAHIRNLVLGGIDDALQIDFTTAAEAQLKAQQEQTAALTNQHTLRRNQAERHHAELMRALAPTRATRAIQ